MKIFTYVQLHDRESVNIFPLLQVLHLKKKKEKQRQKFNRGLYPFRPSNFSAIKGIRKTEPQLCLNAHVLPSHDSH